MNWNRALSGWGLGVALMLGCAAVAAPLAVSYSYNVGGRLVGARYGSNTASYAYDPAGNLLQSATPSPSLAPITVGDNQITLTWPAFPAGFILETTAQLGAGVQWQAVNVPVVQIGDQSTATVPLGKTAFYRLRKP